MTRERLTVDAHTAAVEAVAKLLTKVLAKPGDELNPNQLALDHALAKKVVEAAAPHLAAAERARLADRQQMVDEVKAELDDAFQFTERDGSRHGYVTREWVQVLIATQAASAAAAEREACAQLAQEKGAAYWQQGDSLSDMYIERPFAVLLRKDGAS